MSYSLDIESFIEEVRKQPDIWDPNAQGFRIQSKRTAAWANIARVFINDFEVMNQLDKEEVYRKLFSKWRNLRDSYVRHRKNNYCKRGYLYAPYLTFLEAIYNKNGDGQANESQDWNDSHSKIVSRKRGKKHSPEPDFFAEEEVWQNEEDEPQMVRSIAQNIKQDNLKQKNLSIEYVDTLMPDIPCSSSYPIEDEDRAFFDSLLPAVRDFDIDQKLEFRSGVLKMVTAIRGTKKRIKLDPGDDDDY